MRNLTTMTVDQLYNNMSEGAYDNILTQFGFNSDNIPPIDTKWVVEVDADGSVVAVESFYTNDKLTWNNNTGNYEWYDNKYEIVVGGDDMSEAKDIRALELFGVEYDQTTDAQSDIVDNEIESLYGWVDYNIREAAK